MAPGSLFDPTHPADSASASMGPRPFLSRAHMIALRALVAIYVLTFALLTACNYRPVGDVVFRLSAMHLVVGLAVGLMGASSALTFFLLFGMSLYHYFSGHAGSKPAAWWLWVILLLNVAGVVIYYLLIIEPEQKALIDAERVAA